MQSYYTDTANAHSHYPALESNIHCDVCIIGAGLTGLTAALHLREQGLDVVVLEATHVGAGASGCNGGQLLSGYACAPAVFAQDLSPAEVEQVVRIGQDAVDMVKNRIARHQISCDLQQGALTVANHAHHARALQTASWDTYGTRWIPPAELPNFIDSTAYVGGRFDPNGGHLHPLNYLLGLAAACTPASIRLFTQSAALKVVQAAPNRVYTARGEVHAAFVVFACNTEIGPLLPLVSRKIMPVNTYMIATAVLGEARAKALLPANAAICDSRFVLDYFRRSADHRLLWGGKASYSRLPPFQLARAMRRDMLRVFPQLHDVNIDYAWGGSVDITMNRAPHFGRCSPTVYFAQGFSGHGLNVTALAGAVIAEAISGQASRFDLFARLRHANFPGGKWWRMPLLVLGTLYHRLLDCDWGR